MVGDVGIDSSNSHCKGLEHYTDTQVDIGNDSNVVHVGAVGVVAADIHTVAAAVAVGDEVVEEGT